MKFILDKFYEKTRGFYPFFKYCPHIYQEHYLKRRAYDTLGYEYNWKNPKTLNEKIRWLVFNEKLDLKTKLTDKIGVKSYVAQKLGKHHSAELYGIYNNLDEIDFSILPNSFALKANCGWRMNIFINNKRYIEERYEKVKVITNKLLKINYNEFSLEPQYKKINKKLLIEHLRKNNDGSNNYGRKDLQIFCFNGNPLFCECQRFNYNPLFAQFYDTDWQLQDFTHSNELIKEPLFEKPKQYEKILDFARILSKEFAFVRVDFTYDNEDIHVVEMTFTPASGMIPFQDKEIDLKLGKLLKI